MLASPITLRRTRGAGTMYSLRQFFPRRLALTLTIVAFSIGYTGIAVATGEPPLAIDDRATVKRGATVSVLDSGQSSVLANDLDIEGDSLIAVLSRSPRHGELTLNNDGTFIYRHDGSAQEDDNFRYRAFDGQRLSKRATVRIQITPEDPIPPEIVDQRDVAVVEDQSVEIQLQDLLVVDPDNDYPQDFTLEVGDGENYTRIGTTITPVANFNGQLTVAVRVNDGTNFSNWFNLRVDVTPQNDVPFVVSPVPDQEAMEDAEFVLSIAMQFGDIDDGDSLRFSASGLPLTGTIVLDAETGLLRGTPIRADAKDTPYMVRITATDSAGASATLTFALMIFPNNRADLAIFSNVMVNPTLVGEPTSWNIDIENRGPAQMDEGELVGSWTTSGPIISLAAPADCIIAANDSAAPTLRCPLAQLPAGASLSIDVQGMQDGDGDNTLIAAVVADDPVTDNNTTLVSAQVAIAVSEGPTQVLNQAGVDLAAADLNSDGLLDLVVSGNETIVYLNTGNRELQTTGTTIGTGGSQLTLLDWNGDGVDDVAVAGPSAGSVRIFLGDGSGQFGDSIDVSTQAQGEVKALSAADFDGDGTSELVLAGTFGALISRNQGSGQPRIDTLPGGAALDAVVADLNQDGSPDIVLVAADDRSVNLLRNMLDGTFVIQDSIREGSVARASVVDLNGDGDSDLLLAIDGDDLSPPYIRLMHRQSNWIYVAANTLGASTASDLLTGDVNGDDQLDIVAINEAGVHQVYISDSGERYTLDAEQIVSPGMQRGIAADFNADDSLDVILVGADAAVVELHANNGIGRLGRGDRTAPEITLLGEADITVPSGVGYVDDGATASDDIDGDLTNAIVTSGNVNTTVVGVYTITYTVSDRASNTSQVTRTLRVGVNQGTGGGGGGILSVFTLIILGMIAAMIRLFGTVVGDSCLVNGLPISNALRGRTR